MRHNSNWKNFNALVFIRFILFILLILSIFSIGILASVPPVDRDALTHHLYVPKLYLQNGGMVELPHIIFSYYPMNLDLLYLLPLYFNSDIFPKFIHFAFALATALMIYGYLRRRINAVYGLLGALFFLTIPVIVRLSSTVYVDLGLICFLFAALLFLFRWIKSGFLPNYLIISAVFCGLGLGTKYNGLIGLSLLSFFVVFIYVRNHVDRRFHQTKAIGWGVAFVLTALVVFSPWMIRNLIWTGNPLYPLYNQAFNARSISDESLFDTLLEERSRMSHIQVRRQIYGESWGQIALIPFRVFFQGKDDDPQHFDGRMNPFLLLFPCFAFVGMRSRSRQEKTEKYMMFFFSLLFFLFACAQASIRIRYFSPIIPPLVVLSMLGLHNIQTVILGRRLLISDATKKIVIFAVIFVMFSLNAIYVANRFKLDQPIAYLSGKVTRDEYIQAYRPEYASLQHANATLTKEAKIFGLYMGNRGYYSDIPIDFSIELLQRIAAVSNTGKDVYVRLREKDFTHLLVNFSLFNHWVKQYSIHEKQVLKDFFERHATNEFTRDGYGLLRMIE